jgi:hypothetical protein
VLGHLNQKRAAGASRREEFYLQADAFAVLSEMDFVGIDGEAPGSWVGSGSRLDSQSSSKVKEAKSSSSRWHQPGQEGDEACGQ